MKVIQWLWSKMGKTGPFMLLYYVKVHNWRDPDVDVISWTQVQRRTGTKMMCLAAVHMINGGTRQWPSSLPKLCSATRCDVKKQDKNQFGSFLKLFLWLPWPFAERKIVVRYFGGGYQLIQAWHLTMPVTKSFWRVLGIPVSKSCIFPTCFLLP